MKTYDDVKIGDIVYIWDYIDTTVEETTVIEKYFDGNYWNLKFKNGCEGYCVKNDTSASMGMYACLVFSDKEAVRESINK